MTKREKQKTQGTRRSPEWPAFRKKFLKGKKCAVCGRRTRLQAHHILPFHLHPELELKTSNLIALCENNPTLDCHLRFGHFDDFRNKFNINIREEAAKWQKRFLAKDMSVLK